MPQRHHQVVPHWDGIIEFPQVHQEAHEHLVPLGTERSIPRRRPAGQEELNERNMADPQNAEQNGNHQALPTEEAPFQDLELVQVVPQAGNPDGSPNNPTQGAGRRVIRPPNHSVFLIPQTLNSNAQEEEQLVRFRMQGQVLESMTFPALYCLSDRKQE